MFARVSPCYLVVPPTRGRRARRADAAAVRHARAHRRAESVGARSPRRRRVARAAVSAARGIHRRAVRKTIINARCEYGFHAYRSRIFFIESAIFELLSYQYLFLFRKSLDLAFQSESEFSPAVLRLSVLSRTPPTPHAPSSHFSLPCFASHQLWRRAASCRARVSAARGARHDAAGRTDQSPRLGVGYDAREHTAVPSPSFPRGLTNASQSCACHRIAQTMQALPFVISIKRQYSGG